MQLLIDFIFNKGFSFQGKEFYYEKFGSKEIYDILQKISIPTEIFIVNGPFYVSGYRKALMFSQAILLLYPVKIYGFDLLRDYSHNKNDSIIINNKSFIKQNNRFFIQKDLIYSNTNYSLNNIAKKLDLLKLPHNDLLIHWQR